MNADPTKRPRAACDDKVACPRCVNYYITHDARFPYGCRVLGFKSRSQPADEVIAASGVPCAYFECKRRDRSTEA